MKRNYKFQMYRQPSKGGPAAKEETLHDPIALPGAVLHPLPLPPSSFPQTEIGLTTPSPLTTIVKAH